MERDTTKLHERMAVVETNVETILDNHLPHIQKSLDKVNTKMWALIILLLSALVGLLARTI